MRSEGIGFIIRVQLREICIAFEMYLLGVQRRSNKNRNFSRDESNSAVSFSYFNKKNNVIYLEINRLIELPE